MAFANPLRAYRFRVEIDGIDQWAIQKVTLPELGVTVVSHGGGDHDIKTPSKKTIGNMTLEKLKPLEEKDLWSFEWIIQAVNLLPGISKRNIVIKELGNDGLTTVNTWLCVGCFPVKSSQNDLDRMADENIIETVEISVDDVIKS